jgi:hypothetical protein
MLDVLKVVDSLVESPKHGITSERMTSKPYLGLPARFELDRAGAQSEVSGKIEVSVFPNRMVRFWSIQPLPGPHSDDGDRANHHQSGIWARKGKDHD